MQEWMWFFNLIAACCVLDLISGVYHILTDYGYNIPSQVRLFRDHHQTNHLPHIHPASMLAGVLVAWLGYYLQSHFLLCLGLIGIFVEFPHYYAHQRHVPVFMRILQMTGLVLPLEMHQAHHDGKFNSNFCIFTGWNNWWLNMLLYWLPPPPE